MIVATDLGREGHLIAMQILEHANFRGTVKRASFNAEDPGTLQAAFADLRPIDEFAGLLHAGKARQQADQICNLTLTRAATVHLTPKGSGALGLGRVRTPTLAIICRREQEIIDFTPETSWVIEARISTEAGGFTATCRQAPGIEGPILERSAAEEISSAVENWAGRLSAERKPGKQGPPAPHDLAALQAAAARRFRWPARKTLEIAQSLYSDLKLITYPRVDARVLPAAMAADAPELRGAVCRILGGEPGEPVLRIGHTRRHHFSDNRMDGHEHHAIVPNINTAPGMARLWDQAGGDQRKLAEIIFRRYAALTDADWSFTTLSLSFEADAAGGRAMFEAAGRTTTDAGWTRWERPPPDKPADGRKAGESLPAVADDDQGHCTGAGPAERKTRPPPRYSDGTIITAMKDAWRFLGEGQLRDRLKEAGGIGRPATRDQVVETLVRQGQLAREKGRLKPTEAGMELWRLLARRAPGLVDPGMTAAWEAEFDRLIAAPGQDWMKLVDRLAAEAQKAVAGILDEEKNTLAGLERGRHRPRGPRRGKPDGGAGPATGKQIAFLRKLAGERGEKPDEEKIAAMSAAAASAEIERLLAAGRSNGGTGGEGGSGKASGKQLDFIRKLAAERGMAVDEAGLEAMSHAGASAEIERLMAISRPGGGRNGGDQAPTPGRFEFARDLAERHGIELPEECRTDWRRTKAFIDEWSKK